MKTKLLIGINANSGYLVSGGKQTLNKDNNKKKIKAYKRKAQH
jgi:hypothetical protein